MSGDMWLLDNLTGLTRNPGAGFNDGPAEPDRRPSAEGIAPLASLANACGNRVDPVHITTHALGLSSPPGYELPVTARLKLPEAIAFCP